MTMYSFAFSQKILRSSVSQAHDDKGQPLVLVILQNGLGYRGVSKGAGVPISWHWDQGRKVDMVTETAAYNSSHGEFPCNE